LMPLTRLQLMAAVSDSLVEQLQLDVQSLGGDCFRRRSPYRRPCLLPRASMRHNRQTSVFPPLQLLPPTPWALGLVGLLPASAPRTPSGLRPRRRCPILPSFPRFRLRSRCWRRRAEVGISHGPPHHRHGVREREEANHSHSSSSALGLGLGVLLSASASCVSSDLRPRHCFPTLSSFRRFRRLSRCRHWHAEEGTSRGRLHQHHEREDLNRSRLSSPVAMPTTICSCARAADDRWSLCECWCCRRGMRSLFVEGVGEAEAELFS